ncbi:unnamed protein product, partial [Mesorhabditis belari]|uniref:Uncharacterized protein n=1 Tax=Mesorhabditis belari TaxID=2138241 RepID=A0AAF3F9P6_9BILA
MITSKHKHDWVKHNGKIGAKEHSFFDCIKNEVQWNNATEKAKLLSASLFRALIPIQNPKKIALGDKLLIKWMLPEMPDKVKQKIDEFSINDPTLKGYFDELSVVKKATFLLKSSALKIGLFYWCSSICKGKAVYETCAHASDIEKKLAWLVEDIEALCDQTLALMLANQLPIDPRPKKKSRITFRFRRSRFGRFMIKWKH